MTVLSRVTLASAGLSCFTILNINEVVVQQNSEQKTLLHFEYLLQSNNTYSQQLYLGVSK